MLNKQKGNMYGFVTHTWNPINGECSHKCDYCYMKVFKQHPLHLSEKSLKDDLGGCNFIFVGSSTDMFAEDVPSEWIKKVLAKCKLTNNTYLFQSKNPKRFFEFEGFFPDENRFIIGTTLETNRENLLANAPPRGARASQMMVIKRRKMITIEPIMDFDLDEFVGWIKYIEPEFVNIGADSKGHNLPEPSWDKIEQLVKELSKFTKVNLKENLNRLKTKG